MYVYVDNVCVCIYKMACLFCLFLMCNQRRKLLVNCVLFIAPIKALRELTVPE